MFSYILVIVLFPVFFVTACSSEFGTILYEPAFIYWTEKSGAVKRIDTDLCDEETIMVLSGTPLDIEIFDDKIYWTEFTGSRYYIKRSAPDSSGGISIYNTNNPDIGPYAIAIVRPEALIFWNELQDSSGHNDIWKSVVLNDHLSPVKWIHEISHPYIYGICIDDINRKIYFTANSCYDNGVTVGSGNTGAVYMGQLDVSNTYSAEVSYTGLTADSAVYRGIAVDVAGGYVYYASNSSPCLKIMRRDLELDNYVIWITANGFNIQHIALDLKNRKIYWTSDSDKAIYRADLDHADSNVEKIVKCDSAPTGIFILQ